MVLIESLARKKYNEEESGITIFHQLSFYTPLAASFFLISITHSLFYAALARLPSPEIYLAGFTVAKSLLQVLQNPVAMIRQTMVALVVDSQSFHSVKKFVLGLVSVIVMVFAVLSFSGGSRWIFEHLMGVKGEVLEQAIVILRVFILFPAAVSLRNFMQGIAIKFKKTILTPIATVARVGYVALIVVYIDELMFIDAGILAGLMFLGAIVIEALVMFIGVKFTIKDVSKSIDRLKLSRPKSKIKDLTYLSMMTFFAPLVATSFIRSLARPIIESGLARTISPEVAIASYAVAWGLGIIVISPLMMFHQVPLSFIESEEDKIPVKRFALYLGLTSSTLMALVAFTPIGVYVLKNYIGVTKEICDLSIDVLKIMTILPMVIVVRQYYWGILMKKQLTVYVSIGKAVNLIALFITIFVVTIMKPANPAVVGIIGMISSEIFESIFLYQVTRWKQIGKFNG